MSAASAAKPEIVIGVVAADLAAEVRAHQIGVAVVEAGKMRASTTSSIASWRRA